MQSRPMRSQLELCNIFSLLFAVWGETTSEIPAALHLPNPSQSEAPHGEMGCGSIEILSYDVLNLEETSNKNSLDTHS